MIDPLGLPRNEPVWIFRRGWYCLRGGAGSTSFGRDRLPWSHCGRSRVRVLQTQKTGERAERAAKIRVGREMKSLCGFLKESKFSLATQQRRALLCYEAWVRSGVGLYTTAYSKCDKG